ncbi:unnamed protein product [Adineta steineri]|uniref:Uncharacterized protein n=1 Tax=Adineta steineri TaxID=433720 RepID=A0A816F4X8_9BILA|nr:unnamed protein product [Adineta steineri]CAF1656563.1 unnamed protein product [Adineta steineri]
MRLPLGFFSRTPNADLLTGNENIFTIDVPFNWKFFFHETSTIVLMHARRAALVLKGTLPSYALNSYLFINQPGESTFRSGRSVSGSLSTITTFSIYQFINKVAKISQLNQIKSTEKSNNNKSSLKFRRHQKYRRDESNTSATTQDISTVTIQDIENIIIKAYEKAESIMNNFQLIEVLNQSNLNDIYKLSSFVLHELNKRSTVDHSVINSYDAYDSLDNDDDDDAIDQSHDNDLVECSEDSFDEQEECIDFSRKEKCRMDKCRIRNVEKKNVENFEYGL